MTNLKNENVNKCFSLLRDYITEASTNNKKEIAILALNQLQKITAGGKTEQISLHDISSGGSSCNGKPRSYASPYE